MKALIESHKSKLVKGLKIEDSHIREYNKSDKHVCDMCAHRNYKSVVQENLPHPGEAPWKLHIGEYRSVPQLSVEEGLPLCCSIPRPCNQTQLGVSDDRSRRVY